MSSKQWYETFPKALDLNKLIFKIGEVSKMVSVSSRQLRYWEQKGYIKSNRSNNHNSRVYNFYNLLRIANIKNRINQGYTLIGAVHKVNEHGNNLNTVFSFMRESFHGIKMIHGNPAINLGYFDHHHKQILYGIIKSNQEVEYQLINKSDAFN
ncbi:MerR family transcriptional regulator [Philodulcilactobacillus myokoensis]|uniref:MerR family transcriptional regulator n=1 Tax=Philodulcilactobacillus myokoensis TaxID=2929573 RepID=A0A9W6ETK5_9LACO|nr:MerR family transcriptional regulator [Philodulcilactobacillus myokoensis]GLB47318.1 MerR family transcriptional regulator [Philodulcilactobacillus myokoensis]